MARAIYDGPDKRLRLSSGTLLLPTDRPDVVKAQFNAHHLEEAFGWHEFPRIYFVNVEELGTE